MASPMTNLYNAITALVRLAARFLKTGDEGRHEKAREGIREISQNVGISGKQTQYPMDEVLKDNVITKIPQMNKSGEPDVKHVLRFCVDFASIEEEGVDEIWLELWRLTRRSHNMIATVGQLFCVHVKWGASTIRLNLVAMVDGVMSSGRVPAIVDCGPNNTKAYTLSRFDWEVFCAFSNQEDTVVSAAQRLLFMVIIDAEAFNFVDIDMFCCWPKSAVDEEMERHTPGQYYPRMSSERAGLISVEESLETDSGPRERNVVTDWNVSGGSPILNFIATQELVEMYEAEDRVFEEEYYKGNRIKRLLGEEDGDEVEENEREKEERSPELLRGPVRRRRGEKEKREVDELRGIKRSRDNKSYQHNTLTVEQFKAIMALCVGGVAPWRSEQEIEEEIEKVDVVELTEKMNENMKKMAEKEDVGEVLREAINECIEDAEEGEENDFTQESYHETSMEDEREDDGNFPRPSNISATFDDLEEVFASDNEEDGIPEDSLDELPELVSPESWGQPEDWDTNEDEWANETSSSDWKSSKGYSPRGWSPLSLESTQPPVKKAKKEAGASRLTRSGLRSMEIPSPLSSPTIFSPFLAKKPEESEVVTVSSDSSGEKGIRGKEVMRLINFGGSEDVPPGYELLDLTTKSSRDGESQDDEQGNAEARDDTKEDDYKMM